MKSAAAPKDRRDDVRLLIVNANVAANEACSARNDAAPAAQRPMPALLDAHARDLPRVLQPGDLLVLNDAATLPAALHGRGPGQPSEPIELRLLGRGPLLHVDCIRGEPTDAIHCAEAAEAAEEERWSAVLLGAGDWRTPTEHRAAPPRVQPGDRLSFGDARVTSALGSHAPPQLVAEVTAVAAASPRLLEVRFVPQGRTFLSMLYALGRPVQYSYLTNDLALWSVQTVYAARPWAVEMPSAGRPLSWELLLALRQRGIELAWLTHAAGLSSSGDPVLDSQLPLPERYEIPPETIAAIERTRRRGGRVIAVGTTVVRALEGAERTARAAGLPLGSLRPGAGITSLRLHEGTQRAVVDALLTGLHGPGESHFDLLSTFAPQQCLRDAWQHASDAGYACHEFGDLCLIASPRSAPQSRNQAPHARSSEVLSSVAS